MFSVGIVGLPNVGKSTLFKALTKKQVDISNYPFCTIEPNVGVVSVPDKRLEKLAEVFNPPKKSPTVIEFIDIAGLVKNAHEGEGLGNQFLAHIREVDVICQVVRDFESEKVGHIEGTIDPKRDIETVNSEMAAKDLETVSRRLEKIKKEAKSGNKKAAEELHRLEEIKEWIKPLEKLKPLAKKIIPADSLRGIKSQKLVKDLPQFSEFKELISELFLLTAKPLIYVYNIAESSSKTPTAQPRNLVEKNRLWLDLKLEAEISELSPEEIKELQLPPSRLDQLIRICYDILELITFYTIAGGNELRAWTLKNGSNSFEAAGRVHSDFQEKFIKAEVIDSESLINSGSWHKARELGKIRTVGRDYLVEDGVVIEFKI